MLPNMLKYDQIDAMLISIMDSAFDLVRDVTFSILGTSLLKITDKVFVVPES